MAEVRKQQRSSKVLERRRWTILVKEDPIILTINFMISQAIGTARESGINVPQLRTIYDQFKASLSARHAYTLLAGYHLAWRLAMNDDIGKTEAYQILCAIHDDALAALGENHPQSIAIVTTKARVLHDLGHFKEGESAMSNAVRLVKRVYPSKTSLPPRHQTTTCGPPLGHRRD
jgi:hypothetical protein